MTNFFANRIFEFNHFFPENLLPWRASATPDARLSGVLLRIVSASSPNFPAIYHFSDHSCICQDAQRIFSLITWKPPLTKKIRKEDGSPFVISWREGQQQLLEWGVFFFFFFREHIPSCTAELAGCVQFCEPRLHWIALWNKRIDTNRKGLAGAKTEEDRRKKRRKGKKKWVKDRNKPTPAGREPHTPVNSTGSNNDSPARANRKVNRETGETMHPRGKVRG